MSYKDKLKEVLLATMPYCFVGKDGAKGQLVKGEFLGDEDTGNGGAFSYVLDLFQIFMKRSYKAGFLQGAKNAIASLPENTAILYEVDPDINAGWANKGWEEYETKLEEE